MIWIKEKLKWILITIFGIGVVFAGTTLIPQPTLIEVPIIQTQIGEKYINVFQDLNGNKIEIETTEEEYRALGLKDAGQPTYPNAKWLYSAGGVPIFATSTPVLQDNQYVILKDSSTTPEILIKLPGQAEKITNDRTLIEKPLNFLMPSKAEAAIARDATSTVDQVRTTSLTWAHTVTGSNTILFASAFNASGAGNITSATYNGVAMIRIAWVDRGTWGEAMFYLVNPDTGAHNIVVTADALNYMQGIGISYTGVAQVNPIDDTTSGTSDVVDFTLARTSTSTNEWGIFAAAEPWQGISAKTNVVEQARTQSSSLEQVIGDTNGPQAQGSISMTWTTSAGDYGWAGVMAIFKPVAEVAASKKANIILFEP